MPIICLKVNEPKQTLIGGKIGELDGATDKLISSLKNGIIFILNGDKNGLIKVNYGSNRRILQKFARAKNLSFQDLTLLLKKASL
ncbi:hypothetical protein H1D32_23350 [Anaerobacillus sp. CMMVII]|uniref:hypothetical protein n=1 Tax=Anaerobacillus sp. CMMVII TaxID=2755588 RepID=UPI0021B6F74E|nr:hypothetical protein [Anaerobacillus sp. CMMVII]MCT8140374.1 hypothetical protein [Anaerobacillus sp. CMMVII]